jgi:ferritin-like metal-binding protein YciE
MIIICAKTVPLIPQSHPGNPGGPPAFSAQNTLAHLFLPYHQTPKIMSTTHANKSTAAHGKTDSKHSKAAPHNDGKLQEFFHDEIKDIYWAEKKLVQTLPKLAKAATSEELRHAFTNHLEETKEHVTRLEKVFSLMGEKAEAKKCDAMAGITEEGASIIEDTEDGTSTRDVALILAGQKAEHYEIATYGGLAQIARTLGHDEIASLLEKTLSEEKKADTKLTDLAEHSVNKEASAE